METSVRFSVAVLGLILGVAASQLTNRMWVGVLVTLIFCGAISDTPSTSSSATASQPGSSAPQAEPSATASSPSSPEQTSVPHVPFPIVVCAMVAGTAVVWYSGSVWLGTFAAMLACCVIAFAFFAVSRLRRPRTKSSTEEKGEHHH